LVVEVYAGARRLADFLSIDFTYPASHRNHRISTYPEIQIVSLVLISTKLTQSYDKVGRIPESIVDPTALQLDWAVWKDKMVEAKPKGLKKGTEIMVTEEEVLYMSGKELDDYLDWFQQIWIDDRDPKS